MNKKVLYLAGGGFLLIAATLTWAFIESAKPLPGEQLADLGREHVAVGTNVEYHSNPPTSGSHYEVWTKPGVYSEPPDDRNMVHSLEHGYVIISYNCDHKISSAGGSLKNNFKFQISNVLAQVMEATDSGEVSTESAKLSEAFQSEDCKNLLSQLKGIYEKKGKRKLIITPRPNLDSKIALTAWRRLEKLNPSAGSELSESEIRKIENFIDKLRDRGPEVTMEPPGT